MDEAVSQQQRQRDLMVQSSKGMDGPTMSSQVSIAQAEIYKAIANLEDVVSMLDDRLGMALRPPEQFSEGYGELGTAPLDIPKSILVNDLDGIADRINRARRNLSERLDRLDI